MSSIVLLCQVKYHLVQRMAKKGEEEEKKKGATVADESRVKDDEAIIQENLVK